MRLAIVDVIEGAHAIQVRDQALAERITAAVTDDGRDGSEAFVGEDIRDPHNPTVVLIPRGARIIVALIQSARRPRAAETNLTCLP